MFASIRNEVFGRLLSARQFFDFAVRGANARTAKGIVFVQLYAAYEFAVSETVRASIASVNASATPHELAHAGILSMALVPNWQSVADSGRTREWLSRHTLLELAISSDPVQINDSVLPEDGTHFRTTHLQTIWNAFGVTAPIVPHLRFISRINETVEHRNAIAHGRETAEAIGGRFSVSDVSERIDDMRLVILHLIGTLEIHCRSNANFCR